MARMFHKSIGFFHPDVPEPSAYPLELRERWMGTITAGELIFMIKDDLDLDGEGILAAVPSCPPGRLSVGERMGVVVGYRTSPFVFSLSHILYFQIPMWKSRIWRTCSAFCRLALPTRRRLPSRLAMTRGRRCREHGTGEDRPAGDDRDHGKSDW